MAGELSPQFAHEIDGLRRDHPDYKFIIVSSFPVSSKIIDVVSLTAMEESLMEEVRAEEEAKEKEKEKEEAGSGEE